MEIIKDYSFIKSNFPISKILQFREVGYIEEVLGNILNLIDISEFEFWLIFRLNNSKGEITLPKSNRKQVVFIVADESDYLPPSILSNAFIIFKQYLPDDVNFSNVFHLPVGPSRASSHRLVKPIQNRKYNVFFSGNLHLGRSELYNNFTRINFLPFSILHRLQSVRKSTYDHHYPQSYIRFSKGFHNGISPMEYAKVLYDTKIALCPYGLNSRESMRHFEALRAGAIVITKSMPKHECYDGAPFIVIEKWSELDNWVNRLLTDQKLMAELHERTLTWWENKCTPESVAKYVINKLSEVAI